jgi:ribosomal protein L31E
VDALGGYIAEYPGTLKASEAVQEMARLIIRDSNDDAMTLDSVLETAMASNENSIVVAQIKLELGRYYWKTVEDSDKARALFEDVEESSVLALAQEASQSLRALQSE